MTSSTVSSDTVQGFRCDFCNREFRKESSLLVHLCEQKRRHRERDEVGVRMGLAAYLRFYEITQGSSRLRTWQDFCSSSYYRAFVRFGRHCQEIKAVNVAAFTDWLIHSNTKLDHWCRDSVYVTYLLQHVRTENVADALIRAIECAQDWSERAHGAAHDYLRYGNDNLICHDIQRARVTGWIVYNCQSGQQFLDRINPDQIAMIWDWIDTDIWQRRFRDYAADAEYARAILCQAGW